MTYTEATTWFA